MTDEDPSRGERKLCLDGVGSGLAKIADREQGWITGLLVCTSDVSVLYVHTTSRMVSTAGPAKG